MNYKLQLLFALAITWLFYTSSSAQIQTCDDLVTFTQQELVLLCQNAPPSGFVTKDGIQYGLQGQGECDVFDDKLFISPGTQFCVDFSNKPNLSFIEIDLIDFCGGATNIEVTYDDGTSATIPTAGLANGETITITQGTGNSIVRVCVLPCETQICEIRTCCVPPSNPPCDIVKTCTQAELLNICFSSGGTTTKDNIVYTIDGDCTESNSNKLFIPQGSQLCMDYRALPDLTAIEIDIIDGCSGVNGALIQITFTDGTSSSLPVSGTGLLQTISIIPPAGKTIESVCIIGCETEVCEIRTCCPNSPPVDDIWKKYLTFELDNIATPQPLAQGNGGEWVENNFPIQVEGEYTFTTKSGCIGFRGEMRIDLSNCPGIDRIEVDVMCQSQNNCQGDFLVSENGSVIQSTSATSQPMETIRLDVLLGQNAEELIITNADIFICEIRFCINQKLLNEQELVDLCQQSQIDKGDGIVYTLEGNCDEVDGKLLLGQGAILCAGVDPTLSIAYVEVDLIDQCSNNNTIIEVEVEVNGLSYTMTFPVVSNQGATPQTVRIDTPAGAIVNKVTIRNSCGETQICDIRFCCFPLKECMKTVDFDSADPDPGNQCNLIWQEDECSMFVEELFIADAPAVNCFYELRQGSLFLREGCYNLFDLDDPTSEICRIEIGFITSDDNTPLTLQVLDDQNNLVFSDQSVTSNSFEVIAFDNINNLNIDAIRICATLDELIYIKVFCENCPENRVLTGSVPAGIYSAANTINTTGVTTADPNGDVIFEANVVTLTPGFMASPNSGAMFTARVNPCMPAQIISPVPAPRELFTSEAVETRLGVQSLQVAPNPFSNETTVFYKLSNASRVAIFIYDLNGNMVRQLLESTEQVAGQHQIDFDGSQLPVGVYTVTVQTSAETQNQKILVVR